MFRLAALTAVLLVVLAAVGVLWLRTVTIAALPVLDGDVRLGAVTDALGSGNALSGPVTVRRDGHGVPHIEAATQQDMFVAQGYVTAQDRLWQMDAFRRNANGELAEILGPSLARHDKAQRVFQFRRTAERIYANLAPEDRARYEAYARGVNLFIAQHGNDLPPEFHLLHYKPKPWHGADSISVGMLMVDMLDSRWGAKLARAEISAALHNPKLESDLYPVGSWRDHPPTGVLLDLSQPHPVPPGTGDDVDEDRSETRAIAPAIGAGELRALRDLEELRCDGCIPGSNNWVVAGKRTASGKPLLANDMHLGLNEPNIWYMADLSAPGFHAAGVTLPGVPFVVAGHNEHVAWGFTALYGDTQDLYYERLDGKGNYRVADGSWKPLGVDHEVIHVRGGKDVELDVRLTAHGPLLEPIFAKAPAQQFSLRWSLYDASLHSIPLYAMNVASNWTEFSTALGQWCWPTQNVVYADDQGHTAYHAVGRIPLRPAGLQGVPIGDDGHEWQGYVPFDGMPNAVDPEAGFLATANSRVTTLTSQYPLSLEWADPYRAERIYKMLQGRDQLKPADMLAVQNDVYSEMDQEMGHRFAYAIDHAAGSDDKLRKAADLMRSWDGQLSTDSAAASLVTQTRYALRPMLLEPKVGKVAEDYQWSESNFALEEIVMHGNPDWLPPNYKDWDALLTDAVRRAMKDNGAPSDVSKWRYGSWHVVDIEHPLSTYLPLIGRKAGTGPWPLSGDTTTVKQVGRTFGPSQRFTMDWNDVDGSTENIVLGESGNPYSPYFRDQWDDYYHGKTFALPFTQGAVAAQTRHTLRLLP